MRIVVAAAIVGTALVMTPLGPFLQARTSEASRFVHTLVPSSGSIHHTDLKTAQTRTDQSSRPKDSLERSFFHNGRIRMDLAAGEYRISGSPDNRIHLEWSVRDADQLWKVKARADVHDRTANISTDGPSNKGLKFAIHIPRQTDLYVRLTAGDLRIDGIVGNKDVELHAGDVRIDVVRAEDYQKVDASVWAGEIQAAPFNVHKEGLFRSFDWRGKGPYRLHAKLKAGDLRLVSKDEDDDK